MTPIGVVRDALRRDDPDGADDAFTCLVAALDTADLAPVLAGPPCPCRRPPTAQSCCISCLGWPLGQVRPPPWSGDGA